MTDDEARIRDRWVERDNWRKRRYPDGLYPPMDRWDLEASIAETIRKSAMRKRRAASRPN